MNPTSQNQQSTTTTRGRFHGTRRRATAALVLATAGALAFVSNASAADNHGQSSSLATVHAKLAKTPPAGMTWLQGVLTDQAGHPLDNVNVEVWSSDTQSSAPVASNLTYAGTGPTRGHGVFRVEVPMGQPYRLAFSAIGGQQDGDAYRTQWYGGGRPIMALRAGRAAGGVQGIASGRVRDLGKIALVHQGKVASHATAAPVKAKVGQKATLSVRVSSYFVSSPTGKVIVKLKGHKVTRRLSAANHGTAKVRLPKLHRAGKYQASLRYLGSGTVKPSQGQAKIVVKHKR
jgi:hypothetical protein